MKSPTPPRLTEREAKALHVVKPAARILAVMVVLITGTCISAIFWKMPGTSNSYELCPEELVKQEFVAVALPSNSEPLLNPDELEQISLPKPNIAPALDEGVERYAQIYEAPAALLESLSQEQSSETEGNDEAESAEIELAEGELEGTVVSAPVFDIIAPLRQITGEKPIDIEPIARTFQPRPTTVNIVERSDELLPVFHFVDNSLTGMENSPASEQPSDPFPITSRTVSHTVNHPSEIPAVFPKETESLPATSSLLLQPLEPIAMMEQVTEHTGRISGLTPLLPLDNVGIESTGM